MYDILIIEDDVPTNNLLTRLLQNFSLLTTRLAMDGLALARKYQPSLIILDMNLPGVSGWELAQMLHDEQELSDIPVIAISVHDDEESIKRALDAGCVTYLKKPFAIEELREQVNHYLGSAKA